MIATRPPGLHPLAWRCLVTEGDVMQVAACDDETRDQAALSYADAWDRWYDAGCPLLDDGDLPVDETPEPPPADAALLALANRALGEQLEEARAEVERLTPGALHHVAGHAHGVVDGECPLCEQTEDVDLECQIDRLTRERDEARAELADLKWRVCANADHCGQPRWAGVRDATGHGSTRATELCREAGLDPNDVRHLEPDDE
jgi:hypothetical protein